MLLLPPRQATICIVGKPNRASQQSGKRTLSGKEGRLRSFDLTEVTKYNFDHLCSRECMISALVSSRLCEYVSHQLRANCQCNEVLFRVCLFFILLFCPWQRVVSGQSAQQTDANGCFEMISEEEARKHLIDSHHFPPHNISWPPTGCLRQRGWMFKFKWM